MHHFAELLNFTLPITNIRTYTRTHIHMYLHRVFIHMYLRKCTDKQEDLRMSTYVHTSFECVVNGNSAPAAAVVHNGTVDRVGQTAWIAPGQGCKTKEGGEGRGGEGGVSH